MSRRIALFLPSLEGGGAERAMLDIATGLAQAGQPVDLLLVKAHGPYLDLLPEGVCLIDLNARRALTALLPLLRYLRREHPRVLIATLPHANVIALLAKRFCAGRLPVIARRASTFTPEYTHAGFKDRMTLRLEKYLLPSANAVVALSHEMADDLKCSVPRVAPLIQIIYNPVVWPDHTDKAGMPVNHPWFGEDLPVILSVGRLAAVKGHATLLRAFAELLQSRPARLVVLGEGPERRSLMDLAQNLAIAHAVDFPGFQPNPFAYMAEASVVVLSSSYEGFPNTLVQAMACGTPVVSTNCPSGPGEILEDGQWGRLVPVDDPPALAKAMLDTLDSPVEPRWLVARARTYSAQASIDRYLKLIATC